MKGLASVTCVLTIVLVSSVAYAVTWNVPADAPTIQAGIDSAGTGDTVLVACDTYYEYEIVPKPGITLRSETGDPSCVIIDGGDLGVVFDCGGVDSTTMIEGFTITGGLGINGGGMVLNNCNLSLVNCVFSENSADDGAGIFCFGSSPRITNCIFSWNNATDSGGGIYCYFSFPILTNCTFFENTSPAGGGVYCNSPSSPILDNTIIAFSTAGEAVTCFGVAASALLTCSDVFGNAGGDWVGCIAGQDTVNGNLRADPLFCEPDSGDFTIQENSPCAPANNSCVVLIGADSVGCSATAVAGAELEAPVALSLGPAIPNPFNPVTELSYGIPAGATPSRVMMSVYDATGRRVTTLVDADRGPGTYHVTWDSRDHKGTDVASGVYFYRITWNGRSETRRMVLLK